MSKDASATDKAFKKYKFQKAHLLPFATISLTFWALKVPLFVLKLPFEVQKGWKTSILGKYSYFALVKR